MPDNKPNYEKLVADSKREALAAQAGRKKSVFGTTDSQFTATPVDFNAIGYGKAAKGEHRDSGWADIVNPFSYGIDSIKPWDKYTIPENIAYKAFSEQSTTDLIYDSVIGGMKNFGAGFIDNLASWDLTELSDWQAKKGFDKTGNWLQQAANSIKDDMQEHNQIYQNGDDMWNGAYWANQAQSFGYTAGIMGETLVEQALLALATGGSANELGLASKVGLWKNIAKQGIYGLAGGVREGYMNARETGLSTYQELKKRGFSEQDALKYAGEAAHVGFKTEVGPLMALNALQNIALFGGSSKLKLTNAFARGEAGGLSVGFSDFAEQGIKKLLPNVTNKWGKRALKYGLAAPLSEATEEVVQDLASQYGQHEGIDSATGKETPFNINWISVRDNAIGGYFGGMLLGAGSRGVKKLSNYTANKDFDRKLQSYMEEAHSSTANAFQNEDKAQKEMVQAFTKVKTEPTELNKKTFEDKLNNFRKSQDKSQLNSIVKALQYDYIKGEGSTAYDMYTSKMQAQLEAVNSNNVEELKDMGLLTEEGKERVEGSLEYIKNNFSNHIENANFIKTKLNDILLNKTSDFNSGLDILEHEFNKKINEKDLLNNKEAKETMHNTDNYFNQLSDNAKTKYKLENELYALEKVEKNNSNFSETNKERVQEIKSELENLQDYKASEKEILQNVEKRAAYINANVKEIEKQHDINTNIKNIEKESNSQLIKEKISKRKQKEIKQSNSKEEVKAIVEESKNTLPKEDASKIEELAQQRETEIASGIEQIKPEVVKEKSVEPHEVSNIFNKSLADITTSSRGFDEDIAEQAFSPENVSNTPGEKQINALNDYVEHIKNTKNKKEVGFRDLIRDFIENHGYDRADKVYNGIKDTWLSSGRELDENPSTIYNSFFNTSNIFNDSLEDLYEIDTSPEEATTIITKVEASTSKQTSGIVEYNPESNTYIEVESIDLEDGRTSNSNLKFAYNFSNFKRLSDTKWERLGRGLKSHQEGDPINNNYILDKEFLYFIKENEPNSLVSRVLDIDDIPYGSKTWGETKKEKEFKLSSLEYQSWYKENVPIGISYEGKLSNNEPVYLAMAHTVAWYSPMNISDREGIYKQQSTIEEGKKNILEFREKVLNSDNTKGIQLNIDNVGFGSIDKIEKNAKPISINESTGDTTLAMFKFDEKSKQYKFLVGTKEFNKGKIIGLDYLKEQLDNNVNQKFFIVHINEVDIDENNNPIYMAFPTMLNSPIAEDNRLKGTLDNKIISNLKYTMLSSIVLNNQGNEQLLKSIEKQYNFTEVDAKKIYDAIAKDLNIDILNNLKDYYQIFVNTKAPSSSDLKNFKLKDITNSNMSKEGMTYLFGHNYNNTIEFGEKGKPTFQIGGKIINNTNGQKTDEQLAQTTLNNFNILFNENGILKNTQLNYDSSTASKEKYNKISFIDERGVVSQDSITYDKLLKDNFKTNILSHKIETIDGKEKWVTDVQPMIYYSVDTNEEIKPVQSVSNQSDIEAKKADIERTENDFNNEKESYRVIVGDDAFNDIIESGVIRTNAENKGTNKVDGVIDLSGRPTAFPSFSKGNASMSYAKDNPNHYIIVTESASIQPSKSGRHGKGSTMFPTDTNGKHLKELDGSEVKVYKHIGEGKYELVYEKGKEYNAKYDVELKAPEQQSTTTLKKAQQASQEAIEEIDRVENESIQKAIVKEGFSIQEEQLKKLGATDKQIELARATYNAKNGIYNSRVNFSTEQLSNQNTNKISALTDTEQLELINSLKHNIISELDFNNNIQQQIVEGIQHSVKNLINPLIEEQKSMLELWNKIPNSEDMVQQTNLQINKLESILNEETKLNNTINKDTPLGILVTEFNALLNSNFEEDFIEDIEQEENFSKSFLEKDLKLSFSAQLRLSLFGFKEKNKGNQIKINSLGIERYISADDVYLKIMDISTTIPSNWDILVNSLTNKAKETKSSLYSDLRNKFESLPQHLKNEILHKTISKKFSAYKVLNSPQKPIKTIKGDSIIPGSNITIIEEGLSDNKIIERSIIKSFVNGDFSISNEKGELVLNKIYTSNILKELKDTIINQNKNSKKLKELFNKINLEYISRNTIDYYVENFGNKIFEKGSILQTIDFNLNKLYNKQGDIVLEDNNFFSNIGTQLNELINIEVMLNGTSIVSSVRIGDKTLQGVIANTSLHDINQKLSATDNESIINQYLSDPQNKNNVTLLTLLESKKFKKAFTKIGFSSPEVYKLHGKKSFMDGDIDKIALQDILASKLGIYTNEKGNLLLEKEIEENLENRYGLNFRIGQMSSHTLSDKGRVMFLTNLLLDFKGTEVFFDKENNISLNQNLSDYLVEQVFNSELERIKQSYSKKSNFTAQELASKVFHYIPSINSISTEIEGIDIKLHDYLYNRLSQGKELEEEKINQFKEEASKKILEYINSEVDNKISKDEKTGELIDLGFYDTSLERKENNLSPFINIDDNYVNKKKRINDIQTARFIMTEYVINNLLHNMTTHALYLGDISFYSKDKFIPTVNITTVNGEVFSKKIDSNKISQPEVYVKMAQDIGAALDKRTASLIAPGLKLADSENPNSNFSQEFIHIAVQDVEGASNNIKEFLEQEYGKFDDTLNQQWNLLQSNIETIKISNNKEEIKMLSDENKDIVKNYFSNIADYFNITGTDAQEYTTWRTHLDMLYRQGSKITEEQYTNLLEKISNNKELTEEEKNIFFQPVKPVYTTLIYDKSTNIMRPIYIKSSAFPLLPQLTKNLKLDNVREKMESMENYNNSTGMFTPVRMSYQTANKIGSLDTNLTMDMLYSETSIPEEILQSAISVLPMSGFKIQQENPSKEEKFFNKGKDSYISMGSQFMKIILGNFINSNGDNIFPNLFSQDILELAGISNKNNLSGVDLDKIYNSVYFKYSDLLRENLESEIGLKEGDFSTLSQQDKNNILKNLQKIIKKEVVERGYPNYLTKTVEFINKEAKELEMVSPIFFDTNTHKFEALLQSLIAARLITHKLPGNGHIVGSSEGFQKKTTLDTLTGLEKQGIIWINGYQENLSPTFIKNEEGKDVLVKSQVLIKSHYKYTDSEGNYQYVDLSSPKYSIDIVNEEGKVVGKKLNLEMIEPELLSQFSFRIPTSSHQSGVIFEVAGFLPSSMQDLLIVPKEHTTQLGEDYDIDKRYVYKSNYYLSNTGKIEKLQYNAEIKDYIQTINNILSGKDIKADKLISAIYGLDILDEAQDMKKELISLGLKQDKEGLIQVGKKALNMLEIRMLENSLIDIYKSVYSSTDKRIQNSIFKPLVTDVAEGTAKKMDKLLQDNSLNPNFSSMSDTYQTNLIKIGADGKGGIGEHSNAVTLEAQMQRLSIKNKIRLGTYYKETIKSPPSWHPFIFSLDGNTFNSILGVEKKSFDGDRDIAEQHGENQNVSTDNINKQIMGKRNENSYTMGVIALFAHMRFDKGSNGEHLASLFVNQPILRDYVKAMEKYNSITSEFMSNDKKEQKIIKELGLKYGFINSSEIAEKDYKYAKPANIDMKNISATELFDNLKESQALKNSTLQENVLMNFLDLSKQSKELSKVQQLFNISTSKLGVSYFEVIEKLNTLDEIASKSLSATYDIERGAIDAYNNYDKFIGEVSYNEKEGFEKIGSYYWKATNIEGKMLLNSLSVANKTMPIFFPYDSNILSNVIYRIFNNQEKSPNEKSNANLKWKYEIMSSFKDFISSNIGVSINNLEQERQRLFFDNTDNISLGSILKDLVKKNNPIMSNKLLKELEVNKDKTNGLVTILHTANDNTTIDKSTKYDAFLDLLKDDTILEEYNGEQLTVSKLAQDLVTYSFLTDNQNGATGFKNFVNIEYLNEISVNKNYRELFKKIVNNDENLDILRNRFVEQYFQHYPERAKSISLENKKEIEDKVKKGEVFNYPAFISIKNNNKNTTSKQYDLYKFNNSNGVYEEIVILGTTAYNEYDSSKDNQISLINKVSKKKQAGDIFLNRGNKYVVLDVKGKLIDQDLSSYQKIFEGEGWNTVEKVLNKLLQSEATSKEYKDFIQQILPFVNKDIKLNWVKDGTNSFIVSKEGVPTIELNSNIYSFLMNKYDNNFNTTQQKFREIVFEEILHSITVRELNQYFEFYNKESGEFKVKDNAPLFINKIVKAFELAKEVVPYNPNDISTYYSKDIFEFVAGMYVSEDYRAKLEDNNSGFVKKFLDAIRDMLKSMYSELTGKPMSYKDEIFNSVYELLETNKNKFGNKGVDINYTKANNLSETLKEIKEDNLTESMGKIERPLEINNIIGNERPNIVSRTSIKGMETYSKEVSNQILQDFDAGKEFIITPTKLRDKNSAEYKYMNDLIAHVGSSLEQREVLTDKISITNVNENTQILTKNNSNKKTKPFVTEQNLIQKGTFRGKKLVFTEIDSNDKTTPVGARNKGTYIELNIPLLKQKFEEKAWTKPVIQKDGSKAQPLPENMFKTFEEFLTFVLIHEIKHDSIKRNVDQKDKIGKEYLESLPKKQFTKAFGSYDLHRSDLGDSLLEQSMDLKSVFSSNNPKQYLLEINNLTAESKYHQETIKKGMYFVDVDKQVISPVNDYGEISLYNGKIPTVKNVYDLAIWKHKDTLYQKMGEVDYNIVEKENTGSYETRINNAALEDLEKNYDFKNREQKLFTTKINQFNYSYNSLTNEVIHNSKTGDKIETNETQIGKVLAEYAKTNNLETKEFNKQLYSKVGDKIVNVNNGSIVTQKQIQDLFKEEIVLQDKIENKQPSTFTYKGKTINTDFELTQEQVKALERLIDFAESNQEEITLSGYAGTGKTSIIKYLEKYLKNSNFIYAAPTHAATVYLGLNTGVLPYTIQSIYSSRYNYETGNTEYKPTTKFEKSLSIFKENILVIDESSMISNEDLENMQKSLKGSVKIIYMGDKAQLPEVTTGIKTVSKVFTSIENIQLTEVKRTNDNNILSVLTEIRQNPDGKLPVVSNTETLKYYDKALEFKKQAFKDIKENPEDTIYISYTNKDVQDFNNQVREGLGFTDDLEVGESIVGYAGYNSKSIMAKNLGNSIKYTVDKIEEKDGEIKISFSSKILEKISNLKETNSYKGSTNYLQLSKQDSLIFKNITEEQMNANNYKIASLFIDLFNAKQNALKNKREWVNFYNIQSNISKTLSKIDLGNKYIYNPKTNKMELYVGSQEQLNLSKNFPELVIDKGIDFGYGITIHKSQGATFKNVYFNAASVNNNSAIMENGVQVGTEGNSLNYVGMSRASEKLNVLKGNNNKEIVKKNNTLSLGLSSGLLTSGGDSYSSREFRLPEIKKCK